MRGFVIAMCLFAAAASLDATVVVPVDLADLSHDARAIARGRVVAVEAQWTGDRRTIETIVTLETEQYLKGDLGEALHFRVPGGTLGRFRNIVVGAPQFAVGQRVIVFLGAHGPTIPYLLGLHQGVYRITANPAGDQVVAPPVSLRTAPGKLVRGLATHVPATLSMFERDVRTLVAEAK